jgi:histone deacetylase 1/2
LHNVLVTPNIIKNLISVRRFTRDNLCSVEFDPFGLSVKDFQTKNMIARCNSDGDLYPFQWPSSTAHAFFVTASPSTLWHRRLGHLSNQALSHLASAFHIPCNKVSPSYSLCHACQLGKHIRLPFDTSTTRTSCPFELIHCDLWTSPLASISGYKYYLVILDDFTHFLWTFPLRLKSDAFPAIKHFFAYVSTQYNTTVQAVQCDNGREFDNAAAKLFLTSLGTVLRMSCPYTSPQNGKAERVIRTTNNIVRSLLFQASMPPTYWVEALNVATFLFNLHPTKTLHFKTPFETLNHKPPPLNSLRVFGCLCYPNLSATAVHKLAPRSTMCVFLGYPSNHRGFRCLDLSTHKIIISRHVVFDENSFPFAEQTSPAPADFSFLDDITPMVPSVTGPPRPHAPRAPAEVAPRASPSPPPAEPAPLAPVGPALAANDHTMYTRGKRGLHKPTDRLNLLATAISPIPKSYRSALKDPNWQTAMLDEFSALQENHTWELTPRPPGANVVSGKWIYRHKHKPDGTLDRYKARWVLRGFTQRAGIDYGETFSPVVKPATIRTVLSLAVAHDWPIHQLDVNNAFLHGTLAETVYCEQPSGFIDINKPDHVCRLKKSLYGLKQAPRAWYSRFATHLLQLGFVGSRADPSLFIYSKGSNMVYLLLYVDDIVLTASSEQLLRWTITALEREFSLKDLGALHFFLGVAVTRNSNGLFLSQRQYILDILERAGMMNCNVCSTPVDTHAKLGASGAPVADPTNYRSLVGALQYLSFTRPDVAYAVQQVCLHMHDPREPHLTAVKRILRYLSGTIDHGLQLHRSTQTALTAYTDADWAGCPDTRKSTSGYGVFLGDNLVSWSSKRQQTVSRSSAEAEYRAVANAVAETCWLRQLMQELRQPLQRATVVYCDNISAVYLSTNPVQHQRTKHVEIDLHFVRERVAFGDVRVLHVPTTSQYADIFTKGLPTAIFTEFRSSLNVRCPPAPTAGGC